MTAGTLTPRLQVGRWGMFSAVALVGLVVSVAGLALVGTNISAPDPSATKAATLDAWMAREVSGSPLNGLGGVFVAEGVANKVDPRLMVAIARHESVLGTAGGGAAIHNAFGWGPHIPFGSWEENIAAVTRGLAAGYIEQGLTTIPAIGVKWAPIGAANDPTGLNNHWVTAVSGFYRDLGGDPSASVVLVAPPPPTAGLVSAAGLSWPTPGVVTSGFGQRWGRLHAGIDIADSAGAPIAAAAPGVVVHAGAQGGYGNLVVVDHGGGTSTAYGHLQSYAVTAGQRIGRGMSLGAMGTTGNSTGVHLHFEVRIVGRAVDPVGYLPPRPLE